MFTYILYRHGHAHIETHSHRYTYILHIYMYTKIIYSFIHFFLYFAIHSGAKEAWISEASNMADAWSLSPAEVQREFLNRRYT